MAEDTDEGSAGEARADQAQVKQAGSGQRGERKGIKIQCGRQLHVLCALQLATHEYRPSPVAPDRLGPGLYCTGTGTCAVQAWRCSCWLLATGEGQPGCSATVSRAFGASGGL